MHGYHPFAEDAEIYLPGIEKILHPQLFPVGGEFFGSHASMTLFPNLVAFSLRVTHLPLEVGIFLWQVASIFLLLLACWQLSGLCFPTSKARWAGVMLIAGLLTMPVAGTALYIVDQYVNPRNLAAFAAIFAVTRTLQGKYIRALVWIAFAASVHPLMWLYPFSFCMLLLVMNYLDRRSSSGLERATAPSAVAFLVLMIPLAPRSTPAYHEAMKTHGYLLIQRWAWYEIVGALAPIALFYCFAGIAKSKDWLTIRRLSHAFIIYDIIYVLAALVMDLPPRFEALSRFQPLRNLHLLYIVMFLIVGGMLAEFILKDHWWRWLALFIPLALGMFFAQRALFPASPQVEWPWQSPRNPWGQAFVWVRANTPVNALFALDPATMNIDGEDEIGFRCLAQRSRMADAVKDTGVVSMFPPLADEWWTQVQAQRPWKNLNLDGFEQLKKSYGVGWAVVQQPGVAGLNCRYQNIAVQVCQIP